jgi:hypothetical protein
LIASLVKWRNIKNKLSILNTKPYELVKNRLKILHNFI